MFGKWWQKSLWNWTEAWDYFCLVRINTIPYEIQTLKWWLLQQILVLWLAKEMDHKHRVQTHKFMVEHNYKRNIDQINHSLTFLSLKMCRLPFPFVDTFFSDAGALYLVLLSRADLLWISCLDWRQKRSTYLAAVQHDFPQLPPCIIYLGEKLVKLQLIIFE